MIAPRSETPSPPTKPKYGQPDTLKLYGEQCPGTVPSRLIRCSHEALLRGPTCSTRRYEGVRLTEKIAYKLRILLDADSLSDQAMSKLMSPVRFSPQTRRCGVPIYPRYAHHRKPHHPSDLRDLLISSTNTARRMRHILNHFRDILRATSVFPCRLPLSFAPYLLRINV